MSIFRSPSDAQLTQIRYSDVISPTGTSFFILFSIINIIYRSLIFQINALLLNTNLDKSKQFYLTFNFYQFSFTVYENIPKVQRPPPTPPRKS